jgi:Xaa-Pro aminopeptidase
MARQQRAAEIAERHRAAVGVLESVQCEWLLLLDPANVAWFLASSPSRGVQDWTEYPAIFLKNGNRWIVSANCDTQRIFDEDIDGLGFQLKEWAWNRGRAQLLAELCSSKPVACDRSFSNCVNISDRFRRLRQGLSPFDQIRLRELGRILAHALEATARNIEPGEIEREIAGHLCHRLWRHGVEPLHIQVSADGRLKQYPRHGSSVLAVQRSCVLQATARRDGLHVTASRAMSFGPPGDTLRPDMDAACRVAAMQFASIKVGEKYQRVISAGSQILEPVGREHEWRRCPVGWLTGYSPIEQPLAPCDPNDAFEVGNAVVVAAVVGAASNSDTALVTPSGAELVTAATDWPLKRARLGEYSIDRPDILIRQASD